MLESDTFSATDESQARIGTIGGDPRLDALVPLAVTRHHVEVVPGVEQNRRSALAADQSMP